MRMCGSGVGCSVVKWFGHVERMGNEEFVKVCLSILRVLVGGEGHLGDGKIG